MTIVTIMAHNATVTLPDGTSIQADNITLYSQFHMQMGETESIEPIGFMEYKKGNVVLLLNKLAVDTYLTGRSENIAEAIDIATKHDLGNGVRYTWSFDQWMEIPLPVRKYLSDILCLRTNTLPMHLLDEIVPKQNCTYAEQHARSEASRELEYNALTNWLYDLDKSQVDIAYVMTYFKSPLRHEATPSFRMLQEYLKEACGESKLLEELPDGLTYRIIRPESMTNKETDNGSAN